MHQGKEHKADSGHRRPAVVDKNRAQQGQIFHPGQLPLREVDHDHQRDYDLIGRQPQDKGCEDRAVESEQGAGRLQKRNEVLQEAGGADGHIGEGPDQKPCGRSDSCRPRQDEQRPVQHRADDDATDLRHAVRRQLQCKGGRHAAQQGFGQDFRHQQGRCDAADNGSSQKQRREHRTARTHCHTVLRAAPVCKKHGQNGNQRRETPVAGNQTVGQDRQHALARGVDDAAAGNACGVAAETHAHGQCLLAAGTAALKRFIEVIGDTRQIAQILQQRK